MTLVMVGGDGDGDISDGRRRWYRDISGAVWTTKLFFLVNFIMNNLATKHDMTKLITSFHSESTAHSNDVNIS